MARKRALHRPAPVSSALSEAISIATQGWRPTPGAITVRRAIPLDVRLRREGNCQLIDLTRSP